MLNFVHAQRTKKFISGSIAAVFITLQLPLMLLASPAAFADGPIETEPKVTFCHRTSAVNNPYVEITTSASGAYHGHFIKTAHNGPVYPLANWGDIIPPSSHDGHAFQQNYTNLNNTPNVAGQAILTNHCKISESTGVETATGTIKIVKHVDVVPSTAISFGFTSDASDPGNFQLPGDNSVASSHTFTTLPINHTYTFTENETTGWLLGSIQCDGTDVTKDGTKVSINLSDDQTNVTCTFTNVKNDAPVDHGPAYICHRTDYATDPPYVKEFPSAAGVYDGHLKDHTGDVWYPGHANSPKWGDIIPPFTYRGQTYSLNYVDNAAGMAIYANNCNVDISTVTVSKMVDTTGTGTYTDISGDDAAALGFTWKLDDSNTPNHFDASVDAYVGDHTVTETNTNNNYSYTGWYENRNAEGYDCTKPQGEDMNIPISVYIDRTVSITLCNQIIKTIPVETQVILCHATGLEASPYERLTVSAKDAFKDHYNIVGTTNGHVNDIIPAFSYNGHVYPAQNFINSITRTIYDNNCKVPASTPVIPTGDHVGLGGGGSTTPPAPVTVLSLLTPPIVHTAVTTVNKIAPANQLVNTGSTMLLNIFAGMFIFGAAGALAAVPSKRRYS